MGSESAADDIRRSVYDGTTLHIRIHDSIDHSDRPVLRGDIAFYRDLAQRTKGQALEVGVGTGRVAVELAKAGIRVTGLDLSAAMLAIATEEAAASGVTGEGWVGMTSARTSCLVA
jgi:2-polyprenyl-3-methyl-5-hydroxy-6-metoxy-1,4-benzoquinol methylase